MPLLIDENYTAQLAEMLRYIPFSRPAFRSDAARFTGQGELIAEPVR